MKILFFLIAILMCSTELKSAEVLVDKIVAVVNEDIKTMSDLKAFKRMIEGRKSKMDPEEYKELVSSDKKLLNKLVQETLIMQYAKEQGLESSKDEIDEFIRRRMSVLGIDQKELERQLASSGQTLEDFKAELKIEQAKARIFEKDLKRKISISEGDYESFFKKEFHQDLNISEYRIQHILFKSSEEQANAVYKKIKEGTDFKEAAQKYSEDKGTSMNGGDLGFIRSGDLLPELLKAIKNMSPGDIKGPIKTKLGYQIIRLAEFRNTQNQEYIKNKENIERALIEKQFRRHLEMWVDELKEDSYVKTYV